MAPRTQSQKSGSAKRGTRRVRNTAEYRARASAVAAPVVHEIEEAVSGGEKLRHSIEAKIDQKMVSKRRVPRKSRAKR